MAPGRGDAIPVLVFTRTPVPGQVKTRLIPAIGVTCNQIPLDSLQDMSKVLGVGPVGASYVPQPQSLASFLHEIHQLVNLEKRD